MSDDAICVWCELELKEPNLFGACASVGVSQGRSTCDTILGYLAARHGRGHPELKARAEMVKDAARRNVRPG